MIALVADPEVSRRSLSCGEGGMQALLGSQLTDLCRT
jgi:hypothetical protein